MSSPQPSVWHIAPVYDVGRCKSCRIYQNGVRPFKHCQKFKSQIPAVAMDVLQHEVGAFAVHQEGATWEYT